MKKIIFLLLAASSISFIHVQDLLADTEITSQGKIGDRYSFMVNNVLITLSVGDTIDDCIVTENGLDCGDDAFMKHLDQNDIFGEVLRLKIDNQKCMDKLEAAEKNCQDRYIENIKDFTAALKKKNYELVEKNKELEELKADLIVAETLLEGLKDSEDKEKQPKSEKNISSPKTTSSPSHEPVSKPQQSPIPIAEKPQSAEMAETPAAAVTPPKFQTDLKSDDHRTAPLSASRSKITDKNITLQLNWSNVRAQPDVESEIVGQGLKGDVYPVLKKSKGWYQIILDDETVGWISGQIVSLAGTNPPTSALPQKIQVIRDTHIRSGPGTKHDSIAVGIRNHIYGTVKQTTNWIQLKMNPTSGWIHKSMVAPVDQ